MRVAPVLFAMRPSIEAAAAAVVIGLILCSIGRVVNDAVTWYKDHVKDPYRDLRKKAQESRRTRKSLRETADESHAIRNGNPDDVPSPKRPPNAD